MTREEVDILQTKIIKGIQIAYNKLLLSKQKEDGELIFSVDGKIVKIKARNLK